MIQELMVGAAQKITISFLLSVVLCAGIVFFTLEGVSDLSDAIFMYTAVCLTLFLIIFFCFNIRQAFPDKRGAVNFALKVEPHDYAESSGFELPGGDLEALKPETPSGLRPVSIAPEKRGSLLAKLEAAALRIRGGVAGLEAISGSTGNSLGSSLGGGLFLFSRPFSSFPDNPQLLPAAGIDVIYEKNGIHYINSNLDEEEENNEMTLDSAFAQLVESVVRGAVP